MFLLSVLLCSVEVTTDNDSVLLSLVVCNVEMTTESLTALLSATLAFKAALVAMPRAMESAAPPGVIPSLRWAAVRFQTINFWPSKTSTAGL